MVDGQMGWTAGRQVLCTVADGSGWRVGGLGSGLTEWLLWPGAWAWAWTRTGAELEQGMELPNPAQSCPATDGNPYCNSM